MATIKYNGASLDLVLSPELHHGDDEVYGLWSYSNMQIELSAALSHTARSRVLWHELTHAMLDFAGVSLTSEQEEQICHTLGNGIPGLLDNNHWLRSTKTINHKLEDKLC